MRRFLLLRVSAFVLLLGLAVTSYGEFRPERRTVYMFGVAMSLTDSVTFMTDLQSVDAYLMPNGFLADRSLYTLQLNNYMAGKLGRENMTCAVFFHKSKSKAEKKYQKVRKKCRQNPGVNLLPLGIDRFRFESEEWVPVKITESVPTVPNKTPNQK